MNCEDMMKLPELQNALILRAGESGIKNFVRWIYFADCLQCVQNGYKAEDFIHGGEFVILTNRAITENTEELLNLAEQMRERNIAALGINEGQISKELAEYCDQYEIPLFELPERYPLVDLSQIVCQKLVNEKSVEDSLERLFSFVLNAESFDKEKVLAQAASSGIDLDGPLAVVSFLCTSDENKEQNFEMPESMDKLRTMIENEFYMQSSEKMLFLTQADSVLMLLPVYKIDRSKFEQIVNDLAGKVHRRYQRKLTAGAGSETYLENVKNSFREANFAIRISKISEEEKNIYYYKEQGIYTFISQIGNTRLMDDFVNEHIGKLIYADEINHGNLCETLEKYIQNNCNGKETAKEMFVHRNTLNYRLNKIREIMDCDFDDLNEILLLKLSFMIYKYRKGSIS